MSTNPQHEPTMEEILASIRKIISEDSSDSSSLQPAIKDPTPAPTPAVQEDVLELTHENQVPEPPAPAPRLQPVQDIVFETIEPSQHGEDKSDIFSDQTRKVLEDTFNAIPEESDQPPKAPQPAVQDIPRLEGASVETVFERAVRESFEPVLERYLADNSADIIERMKPIIREWLDQHFPPLLEGAVRAEVERVAKSRGSKRM